MALDPKAAALGLHRFGFGPRAGSIAAIASDPRGALVAEIERPKATHIADAELQTTSAAARAVYESDAERFAREKVARLRREAARLNSVESSALTADDEMSAELSFARGQHDPQSLRHQIFLNETKVRLDAAINAEVGFAERLVWFWSNHFCVNTDVPVTAGAYEREAIRPHTLGRFADLVLAAESHPAMLLYLDNVQSIGPNSVAGINSDRGLNENLAREILELHTLGVRSVYTQMDVGSLANVLTGWTVAPIESNPEYGGNFMFHRLMHEPGSQTVIGKTYDDTGVNQGRSMLADLARQPATAKHVATKLARHFISDVPPPALVERLTRRFLETDGDLKELAKSLVMAPEAWAHEQAKIKRPSEWLVAAMRAAGVPDDIRRIAAALTLLGEPLWRPSAPNGFSDDSSEWLDGLSQRLDVASAFARRVGADLDPETVADEALGPLLSADTRRAIAGADSKPEALTILLMAPEFQKR
jgi:uncharacterized protein (DUF1800 family)